MQDHFEKSAALAAAILCGLSSPALAQQAARLEPVVVTANRVELPARDALASLGSVVQISTRATCVSGGALRVCPSAKPSETSSSIVRPASPSRVVLKATKRPSALMEGAENFPGPTGCSPVVLTDTSS